MTLHNLQILFCLTGIVVCLSLFACINEPEQKLEQVVWSENERCLVIWGRECK